MEKQRRSDSTTSCSDDDIKPLILADLDRSGLDKSDYKLLHLVPLTRAQTYDLVGEKRIGYKIPYFEPNGRINGYCRVRFLENGKGKSFGPASSDGAAHRYSQPKKSYPHVYLPPYLNWKKILKDPSVTILITEGEKKAAMAAKLGIPCMAVGGVWAFTSKKQGFELIPQLRDIVWRGRNVEICYDSDVMWKFEVRRALDALATALQSQGTASIKAVKLGSEDNEENRVALDDYLLDKSVEDFQSLERFVLGAGNQIDSLNEKLCFVTSEGRFFDINARRFLRNQFHAREVFGPEGEVIVDAKGTKKHVVDVWVQSPNRRTVNEIVYDPGKSTTTDLNIWRPSPTLPKRVKPRRWLELVRYVMRTPENAEWFLRWLAYPIQHPGTKLLTATFVYGRAQGVGKTIIVDPTMEYIYGSENFYRLSNEELTGSFNSYVAKRQFLVAGELFIPNSRERRSTMSAIKDMITREKVSVNEKFQPRTVLRDCCNYYWTSNHADALLLEPSDRRVFVVEAPEKRLPQSTYDDFDAWIRQPDGAGAVLHYLQTLDVHKFNPRAAAPENKFKRIVVGLSMDTLDEFIERLVNNPKDLLMVNGHLPDLQLWRAEDVLRLFEITYPNTMRGLTVVRVARALGKTAIEKRNVRLSNDSPLLTLYSILDNDHWTKKSNHVWAEHYTTNSRRFGGKGTRT